LLLTVVPLCVC